MGLHLAAIVSGAATIVGAAAVATARSSAGWRSIPALALSYASATGFLVAIAATPLCASRGSAALLGKRESDGSLPLWSLVAFAPFHAGLRTKLAIQRARGTESSWDEVEPLRKRGVGANGGGAGRQLRPRRRQQRPDPEDEKGASSSSSALPYFLGGWPHEAGALPPGVSAVADVTAELPSRVAVAAPEQYLNVRVWDTHGPTPAQIEAAVRWIAERRRKGDKVLVHCAHGHGRSVTVLAAALLAESEEEKEEAKEEEEEELQSCSAPGSAVIDSVMAHIQRFRPRAKLNARQREALEGWLELRRKKSASVKY